MIMNIDQIKDVADSSENSSLLLMARKDESGNTQTLTDHLHHAADYAAEFESRYANIASMAAVLHDLGKAQQRFQKYLLNGEGHRGDVVHAWQGAFAVDDLSLPSGHKSSARLVKEVLELVIPSHHGDLPDCIDDSGTKIFLEDFSETKKKDDKYAYNEVKSHVMELDLDLDNRLKLSSYDIEQMAKKIKGLKISTGCRDFYLGLFVKYIYSRLVDADRLDAACFEKGAMYSKCSIDWRSLLNVLERNMSAFDRTSEINRIRAEILKQCQEAAKRETGIYRLNVPTGGGKTLASLDYAIRHALRQGKRRIIYVIPYLSITEQTSGTFRKFLELSEDNGVLLEHYSSAEMYGSANEDAYGSDDYETSTEHNRKLAAERWDRPIIVTTMVQFLETVMSSHGTDLRKFHNMADSVIIFDEIQSLPTNVINLFNETVSFLSTILNSTILLCSATQPLLEKTDRTNLLLSDQPDLISDGLHLVERLKRTNIVMPNDNEDKDCVEFAREVVAQARGQGSCLAIVNLKREAREVFQALCDLDAEHEFKLFHLSTSMCGRHRADVLDEISRFLSEGLPVICVSTQLIEAGVDLSFACVVRAMAGLDSILQAAGRCNRNGEFGRIKDVFVYSLKGEQLSMLPDIRLGKEITQQLARTHKGEDFLSQNIMDEYYQYFLERQNPRNMDYPIDGHTTAYNLLSTNLSGRREYENRGNACRKYPYYFAQAFRTVDNSFHMISNKGYDVVVPYGQASKFLEELSQGDWNSRVRILKKLRGYMVSLFDYEFKDFESAGMLSVIDKEFGLCSLTADCYDKCYGVITGTSPDGIFW